MFGFIYTYLKERYVGCSGIVALFLFNAIMTIFPVYMMIDTQWIATLVVVIASNWWVLTFLNWHIGLVFVILGPQNWVAILYYVIFAIFFLPTTISIIKALFSRR